MSAALSYEVNDLLLVKRITGKVPKTLEMNFLGTAWCFFETYDGKAYWLHVESEKLVESARNRGKG